MFYGFSLILIRPCFHSTLVEFNLLKYKLKILATNVNQVQDDNNATHPNNPTGTALPDEPEYITSCDEQELQNLKL